VRTLRFTGTTAVGLASYRLLHAKGRRPAIPVVGIDRDLDIVVAGKSGLYLFENLTVSR
jgi:hypothetical protein